MNKICVVTVCRNALDALRQTVASIHDQKYPELHYIVIDGGSSDGTPDFLKRQHHGINEWLSEPDKGIYDAMNKAVELCPIDSWVIFLNAGDVFASPEVLHSLNGSLSADVDFLVGDISMDGRNGSAVFRCKDRSALEMPGCHQAMLVRASVLKTYRFNTSYKVGADYDFFLRATKFRRRLVFFDGVIAHIAPEGFTSHNEPILQRDYVKLLSEHRGRIIALLWLIRRRLSNIFRKVPAIFKSQPT